MTTREQLLQEIEQVPESLLNEILEFVRTLKGKDGATEDNKGSLLDSQERGRAFAAYLESEEKWSEVYRRLAQS